MTVTSLLEKIFTSALVGALAATVLAIPPIQAAEAVSRSAGPERIGTAVAASADHRDSATDALLATATSFPDALSAGPLAAALDAPLLLTHAEHLPEAVAVELARLEVERVFVLGGPSAVSGAVVDDLVERGYAVERIAGDSRFDTAAEVAIAAGPSATGEAVIALGSHPSPEQAWPDAVASGALAASPDRLPTLLTAHDRLPDATRRALGTLGVEEVLLVGGEAAIAPAVAEELRDMGYTVRRLSGSSRYETSVALAGAALQRTPGADQQVVFATGGNFPDALAAGALAGALGSPLVLVPPERLTDSVEAFLREHTERWQGGVVVGGSAAASDFVLRELTAAVNGEPAPAPPAAPEPEEPKATESEPEERVVGTFEGQASWYGPGFHGRRTASGEPFDRNARTAAHRTLPFGTRVRVTNLANGQQVIVRINDRGPFHRRRVIDLSEAAARDIGMLGSGTAQVRGEILEG